MSARPQPSFSAKRPPRKLPNVACRSREYRTPQEVDQLMAATRKVGRHPVRDVTLILLMYGHGLRVAEAMALRWDAVDLLGRSLARDPCTVSCCGRARPQASRC